MNLARRVVAALLETEFDDDEMLRQMGELVSQLTNPPAFEPNTTFVRATGRSEDIMEAGLDALKSLVPSLYDKLISGYSDEIEALERVKSGEHQDDDDLATVDYFTYEVLDRILNDFCKPFTYVGSHEADGDYGCWVNHEGLEEAENDGEVTKFLTSDPRTVQFEEGRLQVPTKYVWIHNDDDYGDTLYFANSRKMIWSA